MIIASTSGRLFIMILGTKQTKEHVAGDVATTWLATWQIRVITELMKRIYKRMEAYVALYVALDRNGKLTRNSKLLQNYSIFLTLAGTILELIPFVIEVFVAWVGIIIAKMIKVGVGGDSISRWRGVGTVFGVGAFDVIVRPHGLENGGRSRGARPLDVVGGPFLEGEAGAAVPGGSKSCL